MAKLLLYVALILASFFFIVLPDLGFVHENIMTGHWIAGVGTVDSIHVRQVEETRSKRTVSTDLYYHYDFGEQHLRGVDLVSLREVFPIGDSLGHIADFKRAKFPTGMLQELRINALQPERSYVSELHRTVLFRFGIGLFLCGIGVVMIVRLLLPKRHAAHRAD